EELAAFQAGGALLAVRRDHSPQAAESFPAEFVSGNYFRMFGLNAFAGRLLIPEDDQEGAAPAAVMSYRAWQKYGGDPAIVGSVYHLSKRAFTVAGVTPPGFYGDTLRSTPPDFFLPLATEPLVQADASLVRQVDVHWLDMIGRVPAGANVSTIEAHM